MRWNVTRRGEIKKDENVDLLLSLQQLLCITWIDSYPWNVGSDNLMEIREGEREGEKELRQEGNSEVKD